MKLSEDMVLDAIRRAENGLSEDALLFVVNAEVHLKVLQEMVDMCLAGKLDCQYDGDDDETDLNAFKFWESDKRKLH